MPEPARVRLYSDLHCPYAYLAVSRLRRVLPEFEGRVEVELRSLAIEYVDRKTTPKDILDAETPIILREDAAIPYQPWSAPAWRWPTTLLPAFEAVECAKRQGPDLAMALDWRIRTAFFGESRSVASRHVLLELAEEVGLEMKRFTEDFDSGVGRRAVIEDSREGWDVLGLEVSPTLVLPSGKRYANPVAPHVNLSEDGDPRRVLSVDPAPATGEAALEWYRGMLREAMGEG